MDEHFNGKHLVLCNTSLHSSAFFITVSEKPYLPAICVSYRALLMLSIITTPPLHHHSLMTGL